MKILLIEDNDAIIKGLSYYLEQNDFEIITSLTINKAKEIINNIKVDLIILDITLPDGNGLNLYKEVIKQKNIKTIILTANDTVDDIVNGLNLGVDDYITKPFSSKELLARINKALRDSKRVIKILDITYDYDKMEVRKEDKLINLTSLELKILNTLFENINKIVTRDYLIEMVYHWTGNDINDNTITVYLKRIREKLNSDIIKTVKGIGYRIDEK